MKTLKIKTRHVGKTVLYYTLVQREEWYSMEVFSKGDFEGYILVEDVARDLQTAIDTVELFADGLVFPENVLEVLDDIL